MTDFVLDQYEQANLLAMLQAITSDARLRGVFDTGDWLFQIKHRLEALDRGQPNVSAADYLKQLQGL